MNHAKDLTVVAIPFYFGSMGAEYLWLRWRDGDRAPVAPDYERRDTAASLTMGVASRRRGRLTDMARAPLLCRAQPRLGLPPPRRARRGCDRGLTVAVL